MSHVPEAHAEDRKPRGDCFVAAYHHLLKKTDMHSNPDQFILVHGHAAGLPGDHAVNHAWVEQGDVVHEVSNGQDKRYAKDKYYAHLQITNPQTYTISEAVSENVDHHHYGPWL